MCRPLKPREAGNITIFFCMFAAVLIGAVSYSLYVGQMTADRIAEQNAADAAALAMASHAAQGLNMVSANNLSIGASVQVATAVANLGIYLAVIRTILTQKSDLLRSESPGQRVVMNKMKHVSMPFVRAAAGMTAHNEVLYDNWLYVAPVRALEVSRANVPGAVTIPVQRSLVKVKMHRPFQYQGMRVTDPEVTMCQTLRSIEDRDISDYLSLFSWLTGPFRSMHEGVNTTLNGIENALRSLSDKLGSIKGLKIEMPKIAPHKDDCGLAVRFGFKFGIPVPSFAVKWLGFPEEIPPGGIGFDINEPFVFFGAQAGHFGRTRGESAQKHFGFLHPHADTSATEPGSNDPYSLFKGSIEMAGVLTTPIRDDSQINPENCPAEWQREGRCDVSGLVGLGQGGVRVRNQGPMSEEERMRESNLVSGGLDTNLDGSMRSTAARLKYRIGQARAEFRPNDKDPAQARSNGTSDKVGMQAFWPAWSAVPVRASLLSDIMDRLTRGLGIRREVLSNVSGS